MNSYVVAQLLITFVTGAYCFTACGEHLLISIRCASKGDQEGVIGSVLEIVFFSSVCLFSLLLLWAGQMGLLLPFLVAGAMSFLIMGIARIFLDDPCPLLIRLARLIGRGC